MAEHGTKHHEHQLGQPRAFQEHHGQRPWFSGNCLAPKPKHHEHQPLSLSNLVTLRPKHHEHQLGQPRAFRSIIGSGPGFPGTASPQSPSIMSISR